MEFEINYLKERKKTKSKSNQNMCTWLMINTTYILLDFFHRRVSVGLGSLLWLRFLKETTLKVTVK